MADNRTVNVSSADDVKGTRASEGMGGLAKGLAVIEAFERAQSALTVAEAARLTGITRPAARRCLLTLTECGYLSYDGKRYQPTLRLLRLSAAYLSTAQLPALAQPYLVAARVALDQSVSLAVWDDGWSVFVNRAESTHILSPGVKVGARLPAASTATGRVLMTSLSEEELAAVLDRQPPERHTARTVVDASQVVEAVRRARSDGYAIVDGELQEGLRALAVPVKDSRGQVIAAMSVNVMAAQVSIDRLRDEFLPVLVENATALGRTQ
ncbi:IclR family transcriptional regulator [Amycolatopsis deserti]|uniref:IclR family transcriptional regulator n=1 Tax=Amycolatopsis deserti TaxID=185696 RepID=A0ABQ3JEZ2_9PSEU|nr:IclR family transcriptional regulator C-terminal domain-containing protein [Amycolatopsis deserti]GHF19085.1 IclR family transcriptional regulator [Amycolatopsis deserti]